VACTCGIERSHVSSVSIHLQDLRCSTVDASTTHGGGHEWNAGQSYRHVTHLPLSILVSFVDFGRHGYTYSQISRARQQMNGHQCHCHVDVVRTFTGGTFTPCLKNPRVQVGCSPPTVQLRHNTMHPYLVWTRPLRSLRGHAKEGAVLGMRRLSRSIHDDDVHIFTNMAHEPRQTTHFSDTLHCVLKLTTKRT
jgi:hypothetical protein